MWRLIVDTYTPVEDFWEVQQVCKWNKQLVGRAYNMFMVYVNLIEK